MRSAIEPAKFSLKDWVAFVSPIVLVIGVLLAAGAYIGQVKDNTRRIDAIEQHEHQVDLVHDSDKDKLNIIDVRTARIETKLEILVPSAKVAAP